MDKITITLLVLLITLFITLFAVSLYLIVLARSRDRSNRIKQDMDDDIFQLDMDIIRQNYALKMMEIENRYKNPIEEEEVKP